MKFLVVLAALFPVFGAFAQMDDTTGFSAAYQKQLFIKNGDTLRYRIMYPENYNSKKAYPLLVFLHGSGERGSDNEAQLYHGGGLFIKDAVRKQFPAIVIFPQCPADSNWSRFERGAPRGDSFYLSLNKNPEMSTPERLVKELMDSLAQHKIADKKRLYISGLSLGGFGTYDLLTKFPNYFAASFTICGMTNVPLFVQRAASMPLWIFHGAKDDVVNPQPDRDLYKALKAINAPVQYTEFPEANHNSWDSTFAQPGLLPWLFKQRRK